MTFETVHKHQFGEGSWSLQFPYALEGPLTTHAPRDEGVSTLNCYLIHSQDEALLIDTGFSVHRQQLLKVVDELAPRNGALSILPMRLGEMNSICNVSPLLERLNGGVLYAGGPGDPAASVEFLPTDRPFGTPSRKGAHDAPPLGEVSPGTELAVGQRKLEVIRAPLQLLPFNWLYDFETKTLFTNDAFSYRWNSDETGSWVVAAGEDMADDSTVYDHLTRSRYWWLAGADTRRIRRGLRDIFENYDVQNIAPAFGRFISGCDAVEAHYRQLTRLLIRAQSDDQIGLNGGRWELRQLAAL